jgi:Cu2+-exporting ATPase
MNPMFGAAAMSLSSFCVVSNALRLNFFKPHSAKRDHKIRQSGAVQPIVLPKSAPCEGSACPVPAETAQSPTKILKIEGMMCEHCERAVKNALLAVEGVESAEASHEKGEAVVRMNAPADDDALRKAVEAEDYEVLEILEG